MGLSRSPGTRSAVVSIPLRRMAIAAAAGLALTVPGNMARAEPALPAGLTDAVERDLGLTAGEYLRRADLGQRVAGFAADARQRYPLAFAGAWLDGATPVAALTPGEGADAARRAARAAGFEVRAVERSEVELGREKSAFEGWLAEQPGTVAEAVHGVGIDVVGNRIVVRVERAGVAMPPFVAPDSVVVQARPVAAPLAPTGSAGLGSTGPLPETGPAPETTPGAEDYWRNTPRTPSGSVAAADPYVAVAGSTGAHCSFGFHGADSGGGPVNITAGHCDPAPAAAGTDTAAGVYEWIPGRPYGERLGGFRRSVFGGRDYAVVAIADGARDRLANNEVRVPGEGSLRVDGVATPVVGAPICKSGATTGFTCGVVREVDVTSRVSDQHRRTPAVELTGLFRTNACALPGDSGGPVLTGTKALGISSNVPSVNLALCPVREPITAGSADFGPGLIAQPVAAVLDENPGLSLRTG